MTIPKFRMAHWLIISLLLLALIYVLAPQELPVVLDKLTQVSLFAWLGYWIDRTLFPYARPHQFQPDDKAHINGPDAASVYRSMVILFVGCMIRRALIVVGCMLAGSLGV